MTAALLAWLRGHVVWLAILAAASLWAGVEHCRASGLAGELAAARAEVAIRDAAAADLEARYEADRALVVERAAVNAELAAATARATAQREAADARAREVAAAALVPIAADEVRRVTAARDGRLADEVNRRIDAGLLPGGGE